MAPATRLKRERKHDLRQLVEKMTLLEQKAALLAEKMELRMERLAQCEVAEILPKSVPLIHANSIRSLGCVASCIRVRHLDCNNSRLSDYPVHIIQAY